MGACVSRDRVPTIEGAHADENWAFKTECSIKLHSVEFRTFQSAIKRFGYRMDLNEEHLKAIAPEIHMDYEKMCAERTKGQAICYFDNQFAYLNGKHNVDNLMLIGWLLCKHWDDTTQGTELWHILNPTLAETVPKNQVMEVVRKLMYIAVDLNQRMLENEPNTPEKTSALKYLKKVKTNRNKFFEQLQNQLDREVTQESIQFLDQIYRSYDLRLTMAGDKEL